MIRQAEPRDIDAGTALVIASGLFDAGDADFVSSLFTDYFAIGARLDHGFVVDETQGVIRGLASYQPKPAADRVWDLTILAVQPSHQRQGVGSALVRHVVADLRAHQQRLLIAEASGARRLAETRAFYLSLGFTVSAGAGDSWHLDDDLVVFRFALYP